MTKIIKLKVKAEGRPDVWLASKEDLTKWIKAKKFKQIHNFIASGPMLIGADHSVKSVLEDIKKAERIGILTGSAQNGNAGHALSLIFENRLNMYDIGKLEEKDLEVIK